MAAAPTARSNRHWVYLDDRRTHEVHTEIEDRPDGTLLVTTEFPPGSRDPSEAIQEARRVSAEAELRARVLDLENRLRLSGTYFRLDLADMRWTPLGEPPKDTRIDLRALELPIPGAAEGAKMGFHHFHNAGDRDRLLITMPRTDLGAGRHVLAELAFEFPRVDEGELNVLHTRMAPGVLKSSLVRQHVDLPKRGFSKLVEADDYQRAYGSQWIESAREMWRGAASRLLGRPKPAQAPPKTVVPPRSRLDEVREALVDAHVLRLKATFTRPDELRRAMQGGEHAIRRLVQGKRRLHDHNLAYDLTILESALLLEYALHIDSASLLEEEADKLLRFTRGFHRRVG